MFGGVGSGTLPTAPFTVSVTCCTGCGTAGGWAAGGAEVPPWPGAGGAPPGVVEAEGAEADSVAGAVAGAPRRLASSAATRARTRRVEADGDAPPAFARVRALAVDWAAAAPEAFATCC
jgi:hypothetical protein